MNFTGSTKVGRIIAEKAGKYLKRVLLELGGKAPMIVLADADVDAAVAAANFGAFMNAGQVCMSTERIVAESTRASSVVARVRALFRNDDSVRQATDVNRLVLDLVQLLRDDAARHNAVIRLALAERLPAVALDPVQIQQVLLNLAHNAMDAMDTTFGARELTLRAEALKPGDDEIPALRLASWAAECASRYGR